MNNYKSCEERLISFCDYKDNWNNYGADPLSPSAISSAFIVLEHLPDWGHKDWHVYPVGWAGGIVQFEYEKDDLYIEIEVRKLGYSVLVMYGIQEIDKQFNSIKKLVSFLNNYSEYAK
jgi:hypothetical protein